MTDLPPPPPEPWPPATRATSTPGPGNPRRWPARRPQLVAADARRAETQRAELEADMARTGQAGALVVADVRVCPSPGGVDVHTEATWIQGRTTVLPQVDVLVLVTVPTSVDDAPRSMPVRWDVVARVCGAGCWQVVPGLEPPRWITRRWPTDDELAVVAGLSLPPGPDGP